MVTGKASKTVLFAHPDGGFQKFVATLLTGAGYNLITSKDGFEAMERARRLSGIIHLLLADVGMPGMTGIELAIQLHRERPDTRILLISALESGILLLRSGWQFLPKPVMGELLKDRIRELLTDREPDEPVFGPDMGEVLTAGSRSAPAILCVEGEGLGRSAAVSLGAAGCHPIAATSGEEALRRAAEFRGAIHILLAAIGLPDMTGIELARRLALTRPETKILLVSALDAGLIVLDGGWHFLPAPFESEMLIGRVLEALAARNPSDRGLPAFENSRTRQKQLTRREIQVLKLIASGNSTKQAAASLGVAFKTAVGHRSSLMKKLDIHDTAGLVRYAIRAGLIDA